MAPKSHISIHQDMNGPTKQNEKVENSQQLYNENNNQEHIRDKFLSTRKIRNVMNIYKWEQAAICRERDAMIRQQNAKARGEAAICRLLQSKAAEHKERAVELDILADLLTVRVSELLDQCNTSTGDQYILQCDNLKCSIESLISRSEQHLIMSKEIGLEAKERQLQEHFRQQQVLVAIRDFETRVHRSGRQNIISGVNKLLRTAMGNRLKHNALVQEAWAHLQEARANAQEDHERQMLVEKETFWSIQKTYIL